MIEVSKKYFRRKEMDSLLTYLVEDDFDAVGELSKLIKKNYDKHNVKLLRDYESAFRIFLEKLELKGGEIMISALAPVSLYRVIIEKGFTPIVLDVSLETGLVEFDSYNNNLRDKTVLIINTSTYTYIDTSYLKDLGVPVIDILLCGIGLDVNMDSINFNSDYTIISLEEDLIVNSLGGAIFFTNHETKYIDNYLKHNPHLILSGLNASLAISLINDLEHFQERRIHVIEAYKNSILKSGYYTFDSGDTTIYSSFPVIVKKSLKEIQHYCKNNGLETQRGYLDSIIRNIRGLKCCNAKSLTSRTLLIPLSLSMKKKGIELISKILSTLP
ncbi:hypothetical protein EW093_03270 [Thiospirochaeta perfilievii]|uniref:DegT/DnrJ/EryC1/StrS aminotransferase family protein n=1 Tax=Thiospirochaeta perfilievii TaxID=252967 RepID=A0A5C1Q9I4_9SPIO|nr:hypothetical protein [Thiospirochaeta perfilievii]QEN03760.1 hypothetical protein EW093_03270 [Thiospirochaeta perfilievii]